jgi:hypothetical protein
MTNMTIQTRAVAGFDDILADLATAGKKMGVNVDAPPLGRSLSI